MPVESSIQELFLLGTPHNTFSTTLPDGSYYPSHILAKDERPLEFLENFDRVREKDWKDCSFMDLACSEGSTTLGISQLQSTVYGFEGREDAVFRGRVLGKILGYENTTFSVGNVVSSGNYKKVDGIFCSGILYHLEDPVSCLELCAQNANDFIYLDTGHMPRTDMEKEQSKFSKGFGQEKIIKYKDLKIRGIDFAEPKNTAEDQGGLRRGPRSGIGNSNSVWLMHPDVIDLMNFLGFPYHHTLFDRPNIPRLRTCFFRREPRDIAKLEELTKPLPRGLPLAEAGKLSSARDIAFLLKNKHPVTILGWRPILSDVVEYLKSTGVIIENVVEPPWEPNDLVPAQVLFDLLQDTSGFVALALENPHKLYTKLNKLRNLDYIFTSFSAAVN